MAAFFQDVSDRVSESQYGLSKLTSQQGAATKKWWETATMNAATPPDLLYTSFNPEEPRTGSPGKLVVACDGKASQRGGLTVYVDWSVTLMTPSLEGPEEEEGKIPSLQLPLWTKSGTPGVFGHPKAGDWSSLTQDARRVLPGVLPDSTFRLSSPRYFSDNVSNAPGSLVGFAKVYVDPSFNMWPSHEEKRKVDSIAYGHTLLATKGENVEFIDNAKLKVFRKGSRYLCHVPAWISSQPDWNPLSDLSFEGPSRDWTQPTTISPSTHLCLKRSPEGSMESLSQEISSLLQEQLKE